MAEGTCMHCGRDIGGGHEPRCPYRAGELDFIMSRLWRAERDRTMLEEAAIAAIAAAEAGLVVDAVGLLRRALAMTTAKAARPE
jgi:hypothetical protein